MKRIWERRTVKGHGERLEYRDQDGTIRGWIERDIALVPFPPPTRGTQLIAFGLPEEKLKKEIERKVGK